MEGESHPRPGDIYVFRSPFAKKLGVVVQVLSVLTSSEVYVRVLVLTGTTPYTSEIHSLWFLEVSGASAGYVRVREEGS